MINRAFFSFLPLLIASQVSASEWKIIDASEKTETSVDVQNIAKLPGNVRKTWVRYRYQTTQNTVEILPIGYKTALNLNYFDCGQRTMALAQEILYSDVDESKSIRSKTYPRESLQYEDVVPDSVGEAALRYICAPPPNRKK